MRYIFTPHELDIEQHRLTTDGRLIDLEPQVFDLLALLLENAGRLVSKDQLIDRIWQGRIVSESAISARINAARRALGDSGKAQKFIKTVPRRGFQFIADVTMAKPSQAKRVKPATPQIIEYAQSSDGTQIAFARTGKGMALLRAGHWMTHLNMDQNSPVWRPLIDKLSESFGLLRYDQRGTGLSGRDLKGTDITHFSDDLLAVANKAGLDKFPIFATSQGVPVALHFAAHHPARVSKMVLIGGYAQGANIRDAQKSTNTSAAMLTLIENGWGQRDSAFIKGLATLFMPDATKEQFDNIVEIQAESATADVAVSLRRAIDSFDVLDLLPKIKARILLAHASGDAIHPISQAKLLASSLPNARLLQFESNNHVLLPQDKSWDTLTDAAIDFLSEP